MDRLQPEPGPADLGAAFGLCARVVLSGAVRSKAQYRLAGTVLGACTAMLLVVIFANAPLALFLAIGFSALGGVYLSQLDRTPRSDVFLLGGMTIVVIGVSSVSVKAPSAPTSTQS